MVERFEDYEIEENRKTAETPLASRQIDDSLMKKELLHDKKKDKENRQSACDMLMKKLENETFYFDVNIPPKDSKQLTKDFIDTYLMITNDNSETSIHDALRNKEKLECSEKNISLLLSTFDQVDKGKEQKEVGVGVTVEQVRNWAYTPQSIQSFGTFNCSGASTMFASVARTLGWETYVANPNGHAVNIIKSVMIRFTTWTLETQGTDDQYYMKYPRR